MHNQLSLYLLTGMPAHNRQFFRKVLNKSKGFGLKIDFEAVSWGDFVKPGQTAQAPQGLVVTLLKKSITFKDIAAVTKIASGMAFSIRKIDRVHDHAGSHSSDALEIMLEPSVSSEAKASEMRQRLRQRLMG